MQEKILSADRSILTTAAQPQAPEEDSFSLPKEMISNYLRRRAEELSLLKRSCSERNMEPVLRISHQIKGNAASYGFPELEALAQEIESCARQNDLHKLSDCLERVEKWLSSPPVRSVLSVDS